MSLRRLLFLGVPPAFGLVALVLGMDADWDLRNYHYYNAWALLTGREGWDLVVSQIPSFYNPLLDVPYFLLAQWLPARALAFLLGMAHGLNFILLTLLGESLLTLEDRRQRLGLAALLAGAGVCGAVAISEVGTVFYDNVLSLGVFASLLIVVARWERLLAGPLLPTFGLAFLAGLPAGLAFGLKQTSILYPIGLCCGLLLALPVPPRRRFGTAFACGIGVVAATAIGGGYWMWHLWHFYANPLFPHFNQVFHSPWALPIPYRDIEYQPHSLWQRLIYPFTFSFDSRRAAESDFQDFRVLAVYLAVPLAALLALAGRLRRRPAEPTFVRRGPATFLLVAATAAYLVWLQLFGHYRYLAAVEMLAPLLLAAALGLMPGPRGWRLAATLLLVAGLVATTRPADWLRVPFSHNAVEVEVPAIENPADTMVLLAGHEPLSFLLPAFPPAIRFLRIDSTFTNPDQTEVLLNGLMRGLVEAHRGPLLALFIPTERHDVVRRLGDYGLILHSQGCRQVTSPIGAAPYDLCPVSKR